MGRTAARVGCLVVMVVMALSCEGAPRLGGLLGWKCSSDPDCPAGERCNESAAPDADRHCVPVHACDCGDGQQCSDYSCEDVAACGECLGDAGLADSPTPDGGSCTLYPLLGLCCFPDELKTKCEEPLRLQVPQGTTSGHAFETPEGASIFPDSEKDWYTFEVAPTVEPGTWAKHGTESFAFKVYLDTSGGSANNCIRFDIYTAAPDKCGTDAEPKGATCSPGEVPTGLQTFSDDHFTSTADGYNSRECVPSDASLWLCCATGSCGSGAPPSDCCDTTNKNGGGTTDPKCSNPGDVHAVRWCDTAKQYWIKIHWIENCKPESLTCDQTKYKLFVDYTVDP